MITLKPNIGIMNALIRITCGFTMVAWATAKMVKHPWRDRYIVGAILGGMKIGEGITKFCPIVALFENQEKNNNKDREERQQQPQQTAPTFNPMSNNPLNNKF
ncbi:YgaP family membrane protein [Litchfieldia salsa]|uniref:Inner membrane protein YgaP-like transmembrane domain-containing protein n=1 Tax=Litchfieldia salsa TaxID=930152 RepID=A0A1H0X1X0_9BACI|nr:Protein of unknown function [Litchfieldia salsa]